MHYIKPTDTRRQPVNGNLLPDFSASSQFRIQVHASCILTLTLTLTITIIPTSSKLSPLVHATHNRPPRYASASCLGMFWTPRVHFFWVPQRKSRQVGTKTPERIERGNPIWAPAPSQVGGNPCPPFQARIRGGRSSRSHHGGVGAVASTIGQALMSGRRQCPSLTD